MIEDIPGEPLLLGEVDVLRELPQSEVEYLARQCPILHPAKKESLTLCEHQRGVFLLLSGRVRVHEPTTCGNQDLTFTVVEGGTVVGQPASKPRPSRVEALEASVLMVVGSNREAVTRAFGVLRKADAVETRDRQIYVTDAAALADFAEVAR
jgi:hypothetical protein